MPRRKSGRGRSGGCGRCGGWWTTCCAVCRLRKRGFAGTVATRRSSGHPFFDDVSHRKLDEAFVAQMRGTDGERGQAPFVRSTLRAVPANGACPLSPIRSAAGPLVTILPGSRTQEVTSNLPWLLKAAAEVRAAAPGVRFAVAAYKPHHAEFARRQAAEWQSPDGRGGPIEVFVGKTPELIEAAVCCMAVSGSVSLELLDRTRPSVILYWISRPAYIVQGFFPEGKIHYAGEPAGRRGLVPRVSDLRGQIGRDRPPRDRLADRPGGREALVARLAQIKAQVGHPGSPARAAEYIVRHLRGQSPV